MSRSPGRDRGSATVLVLGVCLAALVLVLVLAGLGSAVVARHRAVSAADLAALAAADVLLGRAAGVPCAAARRVIRAGEARGVRLTGCQLQDDAAEVTVSVRPTGWVAVLGSATARARAGRSSDGAQ